MNSWISGLVTSTAFKYLVTAASSWIASKLGLDEGNLTAWVFQLIGVAAAGWGIWEASRNKVVIDGQKAVIPKSDPVAVNKAKTLVDLIKQARD